MSPTALELTPYEWKRYDPAGAMRQRAAAEQKELAARRRRAWRMARRAAQILGAEYGATKVVVFGSLADSGRFTRWSDIDLAAQGIPAEQYFTAVAAVTGLSGEFKIDLVDVDDCTLTLRQVIEAEGKAV